MSYNNQEGLRIPLIIYHYVVIVCHMFSVLRGSRQVGYRCFNVYTPKRSDAIEQRKSKATITYFANATKITVLFFI